MKWVVCLMMFLLFPVFVTHADTSNELNQKGEYQASPSLRDFYYESRYLSNDYSSFGYSDGGHVIMMYLMVMLIVCALITIMALYRSHRNSKKHTTNISI